MPLIQQPSRGGKSPAERLNSMNKHRAFVIHPSGKLELERGDKIFSKNNGLVCTFAYVTDEGEIATQEPGGEVIVRNPNVYISVEVRKYVGTIDLTPTWEAILPALLAALENGTETGKKFAHEELKRMAKIADEYNRLTKEPKPLGPDENIGSVKP